MGTDGFFEQSGYKKFIFTKDCTAYGAHTAAISFHAEVTAGYMHQAIIAAKRRKNRRFDPLVFFQFSTANRTGSGSAGKTFALGLMMAVFSPCHGHGKAARYGKKQCKAKIQQNYANQDKNKRLQHCSHVSISSPITMIY